MGVDALGRVAPTDLFLVALLGVCAWSDLRTGRIYNVVTYPAMAVALLAAALGYGPSVSASAIGLLVGGGALYVMFAMGWMGGGDVKLMAAVGAIRGYPFVLHALFYSVFAGGVAAALILIWRGHARGVARDLGTLAARTVGRGATGGPIPARGGSFPFGVAIGLGTLIALALGWRG